MTQMNFSSLPLSAELLENIAAIGYEKMTPIQAQSLPIILQGRDLLAQAQTGSGKTAAFGIGLLHKLIARANQTQALVLCPTRELADQVSKELRRLARAIPNTRILTLCGGSPIKAQYASLEQPPHIVVGTPGRILKHLEKGSLQILNLNLLVLDEADRMLDLGFIKDIRFLFRRMPHPDKRLSMLYSATLPLRVTELAYEHMNNPQQVAVDTGKVTAHRITEQVYYVSNPEKIPVLIGLLSNLEITRCIIFVNTKHVAEKVCGYLRGNGFNADVLSGDVQQKKRQSILNRFTQGELPIIVATDVAARGIHVDEVSHVINYDLPEDAEDYVHRIGRTARAGASGSAISLACETYSFSLPEIESYIGYKLNGSTPPPELLAAEIKPPEKRPTDGTRPARRNNPRSGNKGRGRHSGHGDRNKQRNPG